MTRGFSLQTCCGAHPPSYISGTVILFPDVKRPERDADHSPKSTVPRLRVSGAIPLFHLCDFMALKGTPLPAYFNYFQLRVGRTALDQVLYSVVFSFGDKMLWPKARLASSFLRFLDHTQRCITVGATPPGE